MERFVGPYTPGQGLTERGIPTGTTWVESHAGNGGSSQIQSPQNIVKSQSPVNNKYYGRAYTQEEINALNRAQEATELLKSWDKAIAEGQQGAFEVNLLVDRGILPPDARLVGPTREKPPGGWFFETAYEKWGGITEEGEPTIPGQPRYLYEEKISAEEFYKRGFTDIYSEEQSKITIGGGMGGFAGELQNILKVLTIPAIIVGGLWIFSKFKK